MNKIFFLLILFTQLFADVNLNLIKILSKNIHALQNERENACHLVLNYTNKNKLLFLNSIKKSENSKKELLKFIKTHKLNQSEINNIKNLVEKINNLSFLRKKFLNRVTCNYVYKTYTENINYFISKVSDLSEKAEFKNLLYQYSVLLMYEESVTEKKAIVSALIKTRNIRTITEYYLIASSKEKIYLNVLKKILTNDLVNEWENYINSEIFKKVSFIESEIIKKIHNNSRKIDLSKYISLITQKITIIRNIENNLLFIIQTKEKNSLFTEKEKEFIKKQLPVKYVFDPNWKPFEFKNEIGEHKGIIGDIFKIIKAKTNLNLIPIATNSWSEAKKLVRENKAEMFSAITENKKRKKYLNFTKHTIFTYPAVLISRADENPENWQEKRVGIKKGYVLIDYIKKHYPALKLIILPSLKEGLKALRDKKIDYFINNLVIANYYINKKGFNDLKVAKELNYTFKLKIALRKDKPKIVLDIIDKVLDNISKDELNAIYKKWLYYDKKKIQISEKTYNLKDMLPIKELLIVGIVLIVVIILMLKFLKSRKDITFRFSVFAFVGVFLISIILVTVVSVNNLEKIKRSEFAYSLTTILNTTHEALRKILLSQEKYLNLILTNDSSEVLNKVKQLDFVESVIVVDNNFHVIKGDYHKKIIDEQNIIEGIKKAEKFGYSLIFPAKRSSKELQKIFFIKTLYSENLKPLRYILVALNKNILQSVLEKGRLGQSGETYLVNVYKQMVSQSRFDNELRKQHLLKDNQHSFLNIKVNTIASIDALQKHSGVNTKGYKDYRGIEVFGAWKWDNDYNVAIITEIDKQEAMKSFINTKLTIYYALFTVVSFVVVLMIFIVWLANRRKKELEKKNKELYEFNLKLESLVKERTKSLEEAKREIELIHQHTKDSIEFASMLQNSLLPEKEEIKKCFKDFFVIWEPKDIVGGDIWLYENIREGECILMIIDCTGHGVPGAFVTMLVKAIEREIVTKYEDSDYEISPAYILKYFNKTIKKLLKQEDASSLSNAGFDGGVLYFNKKTMQIKYASAKTPLFIIKDEDVTILKGDRYSVGYKKNDENYEYLEKTINIQGGEKIYLTTDGLIDQLGGKKCLPFGKKRFKNLLLKIKDLPMHKQKEIILKEFLNYEKECEENERIDDITVVGIKI